MSCRRRALARVAGVTGFRAAVTLNESCAECVLINYQSNSNYFTCRCPWGAVFREMPDALAVVIMMIKDRGSSADGGPWAEGLGLDLRKRRVSMMIVFGGAILAILQSDRLSLHLWRSRSWER